MILLETRASTNTYIYTCTSACDIHCARKLALFHREFVTPGGAMNAFDLSEYTLLGKRQPCATSGKLYLWWKQPPSLFCAASILGQLENKGIYRHLKGISFWWSRQTVGCLESKFVKHICAAEGQIIRTMRETKLLRFFWFSYDRSM